VPFVDAHYRTIQAPESRAISGKSSGGFGAMITPMLRPDLFGALATHAGDALYEYCYLPEFAEVTRHLRAYGGDIWRWWDAFHQRPAFSRGEDAALITALGCSAAFSPGDDGRPVLPVDPVTGVVRPQVWQRWLAWDPVRMVGRYADAVLSLRAVWIDAGTADDYYLDLGAEAFRAELARVGLPDDRVHFELFEATHAAIDYRYPLALSWLAQRLAR
jgi:S-formylglutathione hydrolase FrmB